MKNIYLPQSVRITKIVGQSPTVKLFRLAKDKKDFELNENGLIFTPGQFVLVGKIGWGEAPFGPLSSPYEKRYMEIAVRNTGGNVTNFLHSLKEGDEIEMRGPFGNGFPLDFLLGKDIMAVTGGCGIPPISSLLDLIAENRDKFGKIFLLYGAKNPEEILLKDKMEEWGKNDIKVITTIDKPAPGWKGNVGFVPDLVKETEINPANAAVVMCGPKPMTDAMEKILGPLGIPDRRIFASLERRMQCGVGKCQHCTTGSKYVCADGPVFNYDEIDKNYD